MRSRKRAFFGRTETYQYSPELEEEFSTDRFDEPAWATKAKYAVKNVTKKDVFRYNKTDVVSMRFQSAHHFGTSRDEWGNVPLYEAGVCDCEPDDLPWPRLTEDEPEMHPIVLESLIDIVSPERPKGTAKEYEMVARPSAVIVLSDHEDVARPDSEESWILGDCTEWEIVTDSGSCEESGSAMATYASVTKRQGR